MNYKNIYGQPLKPCRGRKSLDTSGSWNSEGYCDEHDGGVHKICVNVNKTPNFSKNTGQGNWSDNRKDKNHCMCLGAWALYKAKQDKNIIPYTKNELLCESIMDDVFDPKYVKKWNTWNGNELPHQVVNGVDHLYKQCYNQADSKQRQYLLNLYTKLKNNYPQFNS